jgi:hypothetical protein
VHRHSAISVLFHKGAVSLCQQQHNCTSSYGPRPLPPRLPYAGLPRRRHVRSWWPTPTGFSALPSLQRAPPSSNSHRWSPQTRTGTVSVLSVRVCGWIEGG